MMDIDRFSGRAERPGFSLAQIGVVPLVLVALVFCAVIWVAIGVLL
jgi:hypothetical protein